ncbi:HlyD family efflux transporter periplasmic adaptor subunit [Cupriavidus sp. 30B13]|uniref:HlyD family efflux transporter periplasmic adaptor subunit n=1 Tax=Cupriavidus sp. 30B13 TaxID=3384241 RepID=UPI003B9184E7
MKKNLVRIAAIAAAILAAGGTVLAVTGGRTGEQSTDDAYVFADYTLVAPKVSGHIAQVLAEDNQAVRAGDVVARIDDRDFRTGLRTAQAELAAIEARLASVDAQLQKQQSVIGQASATLSADEAAVTFAQQNARRYERLSEDGAGTIEQQQQARFTLRQQMAVRERDTAGLSAARREVTVLAAQRTELAAAAARAQAAVEQAQLNLSYTRVTAPVDGVVGQRSVRVGAFVNAGTALLAVVPLKNAYVIGNFRETQLTHVRPGQRVSIEVDAYPDMALHGHVDSVAPATGLTFSPVARDNATGNFTKVVQRMPVKIVLDPGQQHLDRLRVGMSVVSRIDTASVKTSAE